LSVTGETNAPWNAGQICRLHGFPVAEDDRMNDLFVDPNKTLMKSGNQKSEEIVA
jgi:phage terminase large subunit-like protein